MTLVHEAADLSAAAIVSDELLPLPLGVTMDQLRYMASSAVEQRVVNGDLSADLYNDFTRAVVDNLLAFSAQQRHPEGQ